MVYVSRGNTLLDPQAIFRRLGLKTGDRTANLGCGGAGHFTAAAARLVGDKSTVYIVDILKSALAATASKVRLEGFANVKPVWANLEIPGATNIPENSLDDAFLVNILFESKKQENILAEAKRLLHSGGKLLVVDWSQAPAPFGPPQKSKVNLADIQKSAEKLNLKLIDQFQAGPYHFGLIFQKP